MELKIQRERILDALRNGPLTTLAAREKFGIMHCAGRILDLRKQGYRIVTHWDIGTDVVGKSHRVASYALLGLEKGNTNKKGLHAGHMKAPIQRLNTINNSKKYSPNPTNKGNFFKIKGGDE